MVETYLEALELGYYEVQFALEGMPDEHVWKRPAPGLLSVGEQAGHIAYWEAVRLAGEGDDKADPGLSKCVVKSPLIDPRFSYYPGTIPTEPTDEQKAMTAPRLYAELTRVHTEAVAAFKARNPDLDSTPPGYESFWTYREFLKYLAFHIAYHTGQMYSVRHLLGETTPDN